MRRNIFWVICDLVIFMLKAAVVVLAMALLTSIPEIVSTIYHYCLSGDTGFIWVINMAIAIVAAIIIWIRIAKGKAWFRLLLSGLTFMITLVVVASFWHAEEIGQLISNNVIADNLNYIAIGVLCTSIAYIIHTISQWRSSKKETTEE